MSDLPEDDSCEHGMQQLTEHPEYQAASVSPLSEAAGQPSALAVATGSLPGSEAVELIMLWDHLGKLHAASNRHGRDRYGQGYSKGLADAYTLAAEQLRLRLAAANPRQPEENTRGDT